ncbi:MAG: molybdopterin-dependent oxidoreductase [Ktedonobacterales bacterium]|nr:molybdopterin-dependent oxidoreductase [Ktedonobacterales bacterium]
MESTDGAPATRLAPPAKRGTAALPPRLSDWLLALTIGVGFATGILSLISGAAWQWFIFAAHGMAGLWLAVLLWGKLRRVWPRVIQRHRWDHHTWASLATLGLVGGMLALGIGWAMGGDLTFLSYNLLAWHIILALALMAFVSLHMVTRAKPLRVRDVRGRRTLLRAGALALGGIALWPAQGVVNQTLHLPGATRRFTGSREAGSLQGNNFPTSSWVSDQPRPIDSLAWRLHVTGAVRRPQTLTMADLTATDTLTTTLDCTGGFYSVQQWHGTRIGRILAAAQPTEEARFVSFVSVTGYRWSLPLAEARQALLATQVGGETLAHSHGAPARLVAPGRRGFEWVKWIVEIRVLTAPDAGQMLTLYTSSFTPAGQGQ